VDAECTVQTQGNGRRESGRSAAATVAAWQPQRRRCLLRDRDCACVLCSPYREAAIGAHGECAVRRWDACAAATGEAAAVAALLRRRLQRRPVRRLAFHCGGLAIPLPAAAGVTGTSAVGAGRAESDPCPGSELQCELAAAAVAHPLPHGHSEGRDWSRLTAGRPVLRLGDAVSCCTRCKECRCVATPLSVPRHGPGPLSVAAASAATVLTTDSEPRRAGRRNRQRRIDGLQIKNSNKPSQIYLIHESIKSPHADCVDKMCLFGRDEPLPPPSAAATLSRKPPVSGAAQSSRSARLRF